MREKGGIERQLGLFDAAATQLDDAAVLLELGQEENDAGTLREADEKLEAVEGELDAAELRLLLGGEHDRGNAILAINSGAGGTDACDWAG